MPASTCHGGATCACSGFSHIPHMASVMDRIVLPLIHMLKPQPPTWLYFERGPLDASLVVQMVKNLPAMLENWLWSLGWEDLLEKGTVTNSSILAWRTPWTEKPGRLQSMGLQRAGHDWATFHFRCWSQKDRLASDGTGVLIARGSILRVWAQS